LFKLELSWRSLDGALANKLQFAQILASRGGVVLTIADFTVATASNTVDVAADVERGIAVDAILLEQRDAYLQMDVFRMDQVIRNMITNAVRKYDGADPIVIYDKGDSSECIVSCDR
jgi:signal transduction histidine kinase